MNTNHPTYIKIDNTFNRVMNEINKFEKVFQPGGKLEQAILEIDGDPSYIKDLAKALSDAYEALEEAHYGTLGHVVDEQLSKKKKITPKTPVDMVAEGVLDGADEDGFMARSQLYFLARDAIKLHSMVKDQDDLAPWVSSKIAQASKDMDSVRRYTEYNAMKDAVQSMPDEAMPQEVPSVNEGTDNIDEAKEEMCPEACCGKPVSECSCGPDCEHCDCYAQKQQKMNEGMEFDEKRNDDLQVVAKDMFKNALANAKKKHKAVSENVNNGPMAPTPTGLIPQDQPGAPASKKTLPHSKSEPATDKISKKSKKRVNPQNVIGDGDFVLASKKGY